ncbi:acetyl-CoA synthetase-like protein [Aspergillus steynii IBT 23096]|uniref:Acetyl-CoA synthetase-like protein n=1 Tax=Aspergillus steynii IBT 23096 TaxID=1392250 RepID=A0A2I2GSN7_9EURO|nr:acetyl-CoA synthetase-like protein [Aspergillus steynii IBT 23096]PLB55894.1 acetyl-CoA synthetase-like protein [Aspergillus steynii IBT 23096]
MVELVAQCPKTTVDDLDLLGPHFIRTITNWNHIGALYQPAERIDTLIARQCAARPDSVAMIGPEGSITYGEVYRRAESVRRALQRLGVGAGDAVPLCFEKSIWTGIAMLGVLRAGAAFVLIDPSHPFARLEDMCRDIQPKVVVTSALQCSLAKRLGAPLLVLPISLEPTSLPHANGTIIEPETAPHDPAYIAYTSGSTGRPKGIIVEHAAFCANAIMSSRFQGLDMQSRVLQFASYAFDISIQELLTTLIVGGCVCIPSEEQRLGNIADIINQLDVNWVELTPSVARLLPRDRCPSIQTLVLGGEPMTPSDIEYWSEHVHLVNAYGPAECSVVTTIQAEVRASDPTNIGRSYSGTCWVVNPENYHQLAPIGAIGELLVGGPIVGRGYLNRPAEKRFVTSPRWASAFNVGGDQRFYLTGDMVQYGPDGSLRYIGRRDTEVKISGQRIDLREIECQVSAIQAGLPTVADVLGVSAGDDHAAQSIALYLAEPGTTNYSDSSSSAQLDPDNTNLVQLGLEIRAGLQRALPSYMIPSFYIPITKIPLSPTGKLDRRMLKVLGESYIQFTIDQATSFSELLPGGQQNSGEIVFQGLFAELLGRPAKTIKTDESFFHLGGSSVTAIKLASKAREIGISITAGDVFTLQTCAALGELALMTPTIPSTRAITPASSSSGEGEDTLIPMLGSLKLDCDVPPDIIEEILPCTPMQEALIALALQQSNSMAGRFVFKISPSVPLERFQQAWEMVVRANPILRTRIVEDQCGRLRQIVSNETIHWVVETDLSKVEEKLNANRDPIRKPLAQFALITQQSSPMLVLDMHHAIFDGWSFLQLLEDVNKAYAGNQLPPAPSFDSFIQYISSVDLDVASTFWTSTFKDLRASPYPSMPEGSRASGSFRHASRRIALPAQATGHYMHHRVPSMLKLAWALVVSAQTSCTDVVIGVVESGRHAPVRGIDRITGPTIATLPLRVDLQLDMSIDGMLGAIAAQSIASVPYQHIGMQRIRTFSPEAALACNFQNLLIIQPQSMAIESELMQSVSSNHEEIRNFCSHALTIIAEPDQHGSINLVAFFDAAVLSLQQANSLLDHLESILDVVSRHPENKVGQIQLCTDSERAEIEQWNQQACFTGEPKCAVHTILDNCRLQPRAQAVRSWDGGFTYGELLTHACSLTLRLQGYGVGTETIIPICMERSKWQSVAAVAVMMAGGAFAMLEPTFPVERLRNICDQIHPPLILTTAEQSDLCGRLVERVIDLSQTQACMVGETSYHAHNPIIAPSHAMYVAFTSGSTGAPKGVIIEHGMFHASFQGYSTRMSLTQHSRVLFFASPAFDISVMELLYPLVVGGCVCIPSETERISDLAGVINRLEVDTLILTPSVIRLLSPTDITGVRTVLLLGESMSASDVKTWSSAVRLICGYGPAECTLLSTITDHLKPSANPFDIGKPVAGTCWVVSPENHNQLMPLGAVGELVIGGPIVGRGYLNRPEETDSVFIQDLLWSVGGHVRGGGRTSASSAGQRFYKSGDLVRYVKGGHTLEYLGRKDMQVKLQGQRIELAEIEYQAEKAIDRVMAIADVVKTQGLGGPKLLLFIYCKARPAADYHTNGTGEDDDLFLPSSPESNATNAALRDHLLRALPRYMIPHAIIPLGFVPLSPSGKANRKLLRSKASKLGRDYLESLGGKKCEEKRMPATDAERLLCNVFADTLGLDPGLVSLDDRFFSLGGDSVSAMQLLAGLRKQGFFIGMADFLERDTPALVLKKALEGPKGSAKTSQREDLEIKTAIVENLPLIQRLASSWFGGKGYDRVEDVYPCSNAHEGLIQGQTGRAADHKLCLLLEVKNTSGRRLDPYSVASAWRQLVCRHSVLRSTVVELPQPHSESPSYMFVVIKQPEQSIPVCQLSHSDDHLQDSTLCLDSVVSRLRGLRSPQQDSQFPANVSFAVLATHDGRVFCKIEARQCLLDATSISQLLKELALAVEGDLPAGAGPQYGQYISYLRDQQQQDGLWQYWKPAMARARPCVLESMLTSDSTAKHRQLRLLQKELPDPESLHRYCSAHELTLTNIFQVAWGMVLREYTSSDSVCFGALLSGRDIPLLHSLEVIGPLFNLVPCLLDFKPPGSGSMSDVLRANQTEMKQRVKYQHCSLLDILPPLQSSANSGNARDPFFNTCLSVHAAFSEQIPPATTSNSGRKVTIETIFEDDPSEYDVYIAVLLSSQGCEVNIRTWDSFCTEDQAMEILDLFIVSVARLVSVP